MDDPMRDAWVKHDRALGHIQALNAACARLVWGEPRPYRITVAFEPDADCYVARFVELSAPDPQLAATVGDIVHNLRSALDAAAWQLAIRHDRKAAKANRRLVSFPLNRGEKAFLRHDSLRFFSPAALAADRASSALRSSRPPPRRVPAPARHAVQRRSPPPRDWVLREPGLQRRQLLPGQRQCARRGGLHEAWPGAGWWRTCGVRHRRRSIADDRARRGRAQPAGCVRDEQSAVRPGRPDGHVRRCRTGARSACRAAELDRGPAALSAELARQGASPASKDRVCALGSADGRR